MLSTICSVVLSLSVNSCASQDSGIDRTEAYQISHDYVADREEHESDYSKDANRQRDEHRPEGVDLDRETHYHDEDHHHSDRDYEYDDDGRIYRDADRRREEIERQHREDEDYERDDDEDTPSLLDLFGD